MSNKFRWFTHDHDAHEDAWIRHLVRNQGHVAGWLWWVLLELHHKHGVGDMLNRELSDVARAGLTSTSVCIRVLTEMGGVFEGQSKVSWKLVGTQLQLEIKKFRERQSKLKSKVPATFPEPSVNLPQQEKRREEKTGDMGQQATRATFTPPSIEDVSAYCLERKNRIDAGHLVDHYTARGWMIGKNKMKDWKAAVRTWERNNFNNTYAKTSPKKEPNAPIDIHEFLAAQDHM